MQNYKGDGGGKWEGGRDRPEKERPFLVKCAGKIADLRGNLAEKKNKRSNKEKVFGGNQRGTLGWVPKSKKPGPMGPLVNKSRSKD